MIKINVFNRWIHYVDENSEIDRDKAGYWEYFADSRKIAEKICRCAMEKKIVSEVSFFNGWGICGFYVNCDDIASHKRVIRFFLNNSMIKRGKNNEFYEKAFKYENYLMSIRDLPEIRLSDFIDLKTGEWKI